MTPAQLRTLRHIARAVDDSWLAVDSLPRAQANEVTGLASRGLVALSSDRGAVRIAAAGWVAMEDADAREPGGVWEAGS